MTHLKNITFFALVAVLSLGAAAPSADAGSSGIFESCPVTDEAAPCVHRAVIHGETAEEFITQYAIALRRGFLWTSQPERVYDPTRGVMVWRVEGTMDSAHALEETSDRPDEGEEEIDGETIAYEVDSMTGMSAEDLIRELQDAFVLGGRPLTVPVLVPADCDCGDAAGWSMRIILYDLDLDWLDWIFWF